MFGGPEFGGEVPGEVAGFLRRQGQHGGQEGGLLVRDGLGQPVERGGEAVVECAPIGVAVQQPRAPGEFGV
ncbi:hypothetical protein GCM10027199_37450 [Amycolatopsis magusensis]